MGITWVATASEFGSGQVLLGLADRMRSQALQAFCRSGHTRCADIVLDRGVAPLHCMRASSVQSSVLHQWKDGSREVAVQLPGEPPNGPQQAGTLSGEVIDGWVVGVGLRPEEEEQLHALLCSQKAQDFAALYGLVRRMANGT